MIVAMVQVGHVRMRVLERLVLMFVNVGFGPLAAAVDVPVMLVVDVPVRVHEMPVLVFVGMRLGQHEPGGDSHQRRCAEEIRRDQLAEQRHGERRPDERGSAEMRPGAR